MGMLSLIYGGAGSGKTSALIKKLSDNLRSGDGREAIVIVSDQDAVATERKIAGSVDEKYLMSCDVLSFARLANRVFRECGGVAGEYIGRGGKLLIMMRVLTGLSDKLVYYRGIASCDAKAISGMLDAITRLKRMALSPSMLTELGGKLDEEKNPSLKAKLADLALIYETYSRTLGESYKDAEDDLDRLKDMLENENESENGKAKNFFADKNVYIDSFSGFSGQEYEILRLILRLCPSVTLTIGMCPNDDREQNLRIKKMESAVLRIAKSENTQIVREKVLLSPRSKKASLGFIQEHLFAYDGSISCSDTQGVRIIECEDPLEEVTAAAKAICAYVQSSPDARFCDCAVTMRSPDDYSGMIEGVFASHGIPFYFSRRTDLSSLAISRLIFSALAIKRGNWRAEDVISYIKSGFAPICDEDSFALEKYITTWNIEGRRRYSEDEIWNMNPAGLSRPLEEKDLEYLDRLDKIKRASLAPIWNFCDSFDNAASSGDKRKKDVSVESISRAVYRLLCDVEAEKKLEDMIIREKDAQKAQLLSQSCDAIMLCLDEMVFSAGDMPCSAAKYADIFKTLLSIKTIATIPTSNDEVNVCDAYNLRANGIKNLFILGLNDGVFPSGAQDSSSAALFSDRDIESAALLGYELPGGSEDTIADEYHILASALCAPSDSLALYYHSHSHDMSSGEEGSSASGAIDEICSLFGGALKIERYRDLDIKEKLYGRLACIGDALAESGGDSDAAGSAGKALLDYYLSVPEYAQSIKMLRADRSANDDKLSSKTAEDIYSDDMRLSQSKINTFVSCPFSYTCKYLLRLEEEQSDEPSAADAGKIIHFILEKALRGMKTHGGYRRDLTDAEITHIANEAIRDYKISIFGSEASSTTRLEPLFRRMRRLAKLLLIDLRDEFAQSSFTPAAFELPIGLKPGEDTLRVDALTIALEDGKRVRLGGIADRVDYYRSGNDVYLRVIDYKTSEHRLVMDDVRLGLNAQMLIYMEALIADGGKFLSDSGEIPSGEKLNIHPAGVLYYIAKMPADIKVSSDAENNEKIESFKKITRSGLLIDDKDVLRAMEANLAGRFIPTSENKDGTLSRTSKSVISEEDFSSNLREMMTAIASVAERMRSGDSQIAPLKDGSRDGCKYCSMRPICRRRTDADPTRIDEDEDEEDEE